MTRPCRGRLQLRCVPCSWKCTVSSQASVGVAAVFNPENDDFPKVDVDSVENAVCAPSRGPDAGEIVSKRLPYSVGILDQRGRNEINDGGRDAFREFFREGTPSRRSEDELVRGPACHRRWRTASTPLRTSPRA